MSIAYCKFVTCCAHPGCLAMPKQNDGFNARKIWVKHPKSPASSTAALVIHCMEVSTCGPRRLCAVESITINQSCRSRKSASISELFRNAFRLQLFGYGRHEYFPFRSSRGVRSFDVIDMVFYTIFYSTPLVGCSTSYFCDKPKELYLSPQHPEGKQILQNISPLSFWWTCA